MTQPSSERPVPGPHAPAGATPGRPDGGPAAAGPPIAEAPVPETGQDPFAGLEQRPVEEHVAVFEAEHDRLQRRLGGIDQV